VVVPAYTITVPVAFVFWINNHARVNPGKFVVHNVGAALVLAPAVTPLPNRCETRIAGKFCATATAATATAANTAQSCFLIMPSLFPSFFLLSPDSCILSPVSFFPLAATRWGSDPNPLRTDPTGRAQITAA
jgi:hypothetical protein